MMPTFLIAGAPKAGSSTLYTLLKEHPEVLMSRQKEPGFFLEDGMSLVEYQAQFQDYSGEIAVGEATVGYFADPLAAARIGAVAPRIQLLLSLREPVDRAISHYWWRVNNGLEHRNFRTVLEAEPEEYPITNSRYGTHLHRFLQYFPREQLHVLILEEAQDDWRSAMAGVAAFLGVDAAPLALMRVENRATAVRSRTVKRAIDTIRRSTVLRHVPAPARRVGIAGVRTITARNTRSFRTPHVEQADRQRLKELFDDEVRLVEEFLARPIPSWRR